MLIILALLFSSVLMCGCGATDDYIEAMEGTEEYMNRILEEPGYGDEWKVIGLARSGANVEEGFFDTYYSNLEQTVVTAKGQLNERKYTEYSRVILALTAIGKNPTDVGGYNLVEKLTDTAAVKVQGINGPIWALIALDSGDYEGQRKTFLADILEEEVPGGGFSLTGNKAECDLTAMAIQALAPYVADDEAVAAAVERGLAFLNTCEKQSAESLSQTIVALATAGIDSKAYVTELLSYQISDGGFCHELPKEGEVAEANGIATEQAYYALAAYDRFVQGESTLYDMK